MTRKQELYPQLLRLDGVLKLAGDEVVVRLLLELLDANKRFSEFSLTNSSKTLSSRLKLLEKHGLLTRTLHAEVPPRSEYAITEKGREFASIIQGILQWEQSWK